MVARSRLDVLPTTLVVVSIAMLACGERAPSGAVSASAALASASALTVASPSAAAPSASGDAATARVAELRAKLGEGFFFEVDAPFVIAGDSPRPQFDEQVETFRWAIGKLQKQFFERRPSVVNDVFLFRDAESYERHTRALFHETPQSPYGYYRADRAALIMNIGTGGGTLVHEVVHAFMVENFPACPPWFNEGLGSLFERPAELDGQLQGFPNWRQPILQSAIDDKRTIPLSSLFHLDGPGFYGKAYDVHYAQARYLLYWAQLHDKLTPLYREMVAHREEDPSGEAAVKRVLGEPDLAAFQRRWEKWARALPAPD